MLFSLLLTLSVLIPDIREPPGGSHRRGSKISLYSRTIRVRDSPTIFTRASFISVVRDVFARTTENRVRESRACSAVTLTSIRRRQTNPVVEQLKAGRERKSEIKSGKERLARARRSRDTESTGGNPRCGTALFLFFSFLSLFDFTGNDGRRREQRRCNKRYHRRESRPSGERAASCRCFDACNPTTSCV